MTDDGSKDVLLFAAQNLAGEAMEVWREAAEQEARSVAAALRARKTYTLAASLVKTLEAM